jgi:prevent-host-death family protein
MVKTLRESKAKLSELVERASQGEDILISVRGKVKAKLTRVSPQKKLDKKAWAEELRVVQQKYSTGKAVLPIEKILEDIREERL